MFVKWSCGCRGLLLNETSWVIDECIKNPQTPDEPLGIFVEDHMENGYKELPEEEATKLLKELNLLVHDGYAFRRMQSMMSLESSGR